MFRVFSDEQHLAHAVFDGWHRPTMMSGYGGGNRISESPLEYSDASERLVYLPQHPRYHAFIDIDVGLES